MDEMPCISLDLYIPINQHRRGGFPCPPVNFVYPFGWIWETNPTTYNTKKKEHQRQFVLGISRPKTTIFGT